MTAPHGLGKPNGPEFVSPPLPHHPLSPPLPPAEPAQLIHEPWKPPRWLVAGAVTLAAALGVTAAIGIVAGFTSVDPAPGTDRPTTTARPARSTGPADIAAAVLPSVVWVEVRRADTVATGSGFVIDARGYLISNSHLLEGAVSVTVITSEGERLNATVVGRDPETDVAVLRVLDRLPALRLGVSASLRAGEMVLAFGAQPGQPGTVTAGVVSVQDREVRLGETSQHAIQTDAVVDSGNSGGPLVNAYGEVIGMNTVLATVAGAGTAGIGFAIPIDRVAPIADNLIRNG